MSSQTAEPEQLAYHAWQGSSEAADRTFSGLFIQTPSFPRSWGFVWQTPYSCCLKTATCISARRLLTVSVTSSQNKMGHAAVGHIPCSSELTVDKGRSLLRGAGELRSVSRVQALR